MNDIILAGLYITCYNGYMQDMELGMKCIDYRAVEKFPIKTPTFGMSTTITTKYHYIVIQADTTKEDPWALLLP